MIRELVYVVLGLVLVLYAADFVLGYRDDPREPPRLRSKVPLIGHLLGLIQNGTSYYSKMSKTTNVEIYTLGVLNHKIYVSNSNRLMPFIQKSAKTLSFKPFLQTAMRTHCAASDHAYQTFGDFAFVDGFSSAVRQSLAPGPELDKQNLRMGDRVLIDLATLLDEASSGGSPKTVYLLKWVRHLVVQASSCGVHGVEHPFVRPEVEDAYWKWQGYIPLHVAGLDIRGTGHAARNVISDAFRQYIKAIPEDASLLLRERVRAQREAGFSDYDLAEHETGGTTAIFGNTSPTLFWTIWELFSRDGLLAEVRREVESQAVTGSAGAGFQLDVAALKHRCPLLLSVYQETQRTRHVHANIRKVLGDTVLDGKYLLKAGNFLQMPGAPIHGNEGLWGASASEFDPYRFVGDKKQGGNSSVPGSAFLAWGAPPHLCPARQFASTEILIAVALLAVRADLRPAGGSSWAYPAVDATDMVTILNPKKDPLVEVVAREEWRGQWTLEMSESTNRISLASG